jgi:lantibiotic biosynthesis protein
MRSPLDRTLPFLEAADRIGCRLCRDALWSGGRCNWLGWSAAREPRGWVAVHRAQGVALGDGLAGIALFLAQLHAITEDAICRETLVGALRQLEASLARTGPDGLPPGYFLGAGGIASAYLAIAEVLRDDRYVDAGLSVLRGAARPAHDGAGYDVMAGTAGLIPVLLRAGASLEQDRLTEAAVRYGRGLLAAGIRSDSEMSWPDWARPADPHPLGFAFGASGIACALLDLYRATGEDEFLDAGMAGLRYERGRFDVQRPGWPHLRTEAIAPCGLAVGGPQADHPIAWCHGAPAILSGLVRSRELLASIGLPPEGDDEALEAALGITGRAAEPGLAMPLFGLCHGRAGCADLLAQAAGLLDRPELHQAAAAVGRLGLDRYHERREPWPCALEGFGECPSLLRGLSGIGLFYLRLYRPESVESALAPPAHSAVMPVSHGGGPR